MAGRMDRLREAIERRLAPERLEIEDESARHAGHAGMREAGLRETGAGAGGATHYAMLVVSGAFNGLSRVQRSRLVHGLLADEFGGGLHALSLTLRTPQEAAARQGVQAAARPAG